eukprot:scaffold71750_cov30-Tisochrysis_lutea.AAC.2
MQNSQQEAIMRRQRARHIFLLTDILTMCILQVRKVQAARDVCAHRTDRGYTFVRRVDDPPLDLTATSLSGESTCR